MQRKSFYAIFRNRRFKRIGLVLLLFLLLYLVLFHWDILFMPLRNRPDEIVLYHYGTVTHLKPEEKPFEDMYDLLRPCANATIADAIQMKASLADMRTAVTPDKYLSNGMVIQILYKETQNTRFLGDNPYKKLYYILEPPPDLEPTYYDKDYYIVYETLHRKNHYCAMTNIPFPQKAVDYLHSVTGEQKPDGG